MTESAEGATTTAGEVAELPPGCPAGRYLTFSVAGDVYAVHIGEIAEIIGFRALTVVPMTPSHIRGVLNLRGRVLPVVDLAARFSLAPSEVGRRTSVLVVETSSLEESNSSMASQGIGIMVDLVNKVVQFGAEDLKPPPTFGAGVQSDFINGMAKTDDGFIIVLNLDRVLDFREVSTTLATAGYDAALLGDTAA